MTACPRGIAEIEEKSTGHITNVQFNKCVVHKCKVKAQPVAYNIIKRIKLHAGRLKPCIITYLPKVAIPVHTLRSSGLNQVLASLVGA